MIEIRVYSEKAGRSSRLANEISQDLSGLSVRQRRKFGQEGIKSLEDRFKEYEDKVREKQNKVDQLRVELKVPDAVVSENMPTMLLSAETLRHIEGLAH